MLIALRLVAASLVGLVGTAFVADGASAPRTGGYTTASSYPPRTGPETVMPSKKIVFRHGDISWLPELAAQAGWPRDTWDKLGQIILRESGGCPVRIGGSRVDKDCNTIKMVTWSHPSDTGLLQINGVHWKEDHPEYVGRVCKTMGVCTQEQLFDPLTNLRAGKLLYDIAGWDPWTPIKDR
jgi:hypothetical protein